MHFQLRINTKILAYSVNSSFEDCQQMALHVLFLGNKYQYSLPVICSLWGVIWSSWFHSRQPKTILLKFQAIFENKSAVLRIFSIIIICLPHISHPNPHYFDPTPPPLVHPSYISPFPQFCNHNLILPMILPFYATFYIELKVVINILPHNSISWIYYYMTFIIHPCPNYDRD